MVGEERRGTNSNFHRPEVEDWWKNVLRSPTFVVAPMVDASELPWRLLSRRYKAQLCFTPMIHSRSFVHDKKYRNDHLTPITSCPEEDRPLIVQFCGNDPNILTQAAAIVKDHCDGVDINVGCPQAIAKRGHYGAYLQNEWELLAQIVKGISTLGIPVSCKIRIFPEVERTVKYAKMLEAAGSWMISVHGRTITQKGPMTGLANWSYIKAVKEAVHVPVLANGNIQYLPDVVKCMEETGVDGVMSAEGNLHNPALFSGIQPPVWEVASQYLDLVHKYPCPVSYMRGHLFKLFYHIMVLEENIDLREELAKANNIADFEIVTAEIRERYEKRSSEEWVQEMSSVELTPGHKPLPFPPWICQPYERPPPTTSPLHRPRPVDSLKIEFKEGTGGESRNRLKRMKKNPNKDWNAVRVPMTLCSDSACTNPVGSKCDCCKICCKVRCFRDYIDCDHHRNFGSKTTRSRSPSRVISESESQVLVVQSET